MGWTGLYEKPRGSVSEFLARECLTWSSVSAEAKPQIVATCQKGSTYFYAVKFPKAFYDETGCKYPRGFMPDLFGAVTAAVVILTERNDGEFLYKSMDETCGPYASGATKAFMSTLSPLTDEAEMAKAWRQRQAA